MKRGPRIFSFFHQNDKASSHLFFALILSANIFTLITYQNTWRHTRNLLDQDFFGYYTAARLPRHEMYNLDRQKEFQTAILGQPYALPAGVMLFQHPPLLVPIVSVLSTNDYEESYWRFYAFLFFICLLCCAVIYLILRDAGQSSITAFTCAFTALLFYPLCWSVRTGQDSAIVLLGVLLWALFLQRENDAAAGIALSLSVIKPQLALVFAAATFAHSRRAFFWFVIASATLTGLSVLYVGTGGTLDLIKNIRLTSDGEAFGVFMSNQYHFMGLLARLGITKSVVSAVGYAAFIGSLFCLALWRGKAVGPIRLGFIGLIAVFFSPNLHLHDLALLLLPMTMLARFARKEDAVLSFIPLSVLLFVFVAWALLAYVLQAGLAVRLFLNRTRA